MQMHTHEDFNVRLQQLESEEARLESYLSKHANSLDNIEISKINNDLTAVRLEKNEIEQIISGAFY